MRKAEAATQHPTIKTSIVPTMDILVDKSTIHTQIHL
jgi:hypothetical protein